MKEDIKVGDIVICVRVGKLNYKNPNTVPPPLKLNAEYIVSSVKTCPCGHKSFDVGISSISGNTTCTSCGRRTLNEPIWWCAAERFVKKDTRSIEEQISDAVEVENYELAEKLKNEKI